MGNMTDLEYGKFDPSGRIKVVPSPISPYVASDQIVAGGFTYFGFLAEDGKFYIQRQQVDGDNIYWRYAKGDTDYATKILTPGTGLSYDYFSEIF